MVWPESVVMVVSVLPLIFFSSAFFMTAAVVIIPAYAQTAVVIVEPSEGSPPPPPCKLSITSMEISSLKWNGHERNNPDGTYFPGDAFKVVLGIGKKHCTDIRYKITGSDGLDIACDDCMSTNAHISGSASPGTYTIRALVRGDGPGGDDSDSESLKVRVIDPVITVKVFPANITDRNGYLMRNADGTYYINDVVALKYEVDYRFKHERRGIIEPEVTRVHPYPRIADLDCLQESCTLVVPETQATAEYRAQYTYATGVAVANATASQGLGPKDFQFDVRLKNAGAYTVMQKSYTHTVSIVDYRPVFGAVYPYLNLKDDVGSDTYEHRLVVGVHYLGSMDASDGTVKPLRRAKVNYYTNNVAALVFGTGNTADITKDAELTWMYTEHFGDSPVATAAALVVSTEQGKSAVIEREGHAKFVSRMLGYLPDAEPWIKTANITALQKFYSVNFGGKGSTELFSASYRYPDARFTTSIVTVNAIDENGYTIDMPVKITVNLRPPGTISVCEYYEKHALYSTAGDENIAMMARSDVYSCDGSGGGDNGKNNDSAGIITVAGTGTAYVLANATALVPPDGMPYGVVYPGGVHTMPQDLVLSLPHYLSLNVSVGSAAKDYSVPLYDSGRAYNLRIMANVGQNNALAVERANSGASETVSVRPADRELFGSIAVLKVDGKETPSCRPYGGLACTANIPGEATISATNAWGGRAVTTVAAPAKGDRPTSSSVGQIPEMFPSGGGEVRVMVLVSVAGAAAAAVALRKWLSWTGDAFA